MGGRIDDLEKSISELMEQVSALIHVITVLKCICNNYLFQAGIEAETES